MPGFVPNTGYKNGAQHRRLRLKDPMLLLGNTAKKQVKKRYKIIPEGKKS